MQCTVPYIEEKAKTMTRIDINDPNLTLRDRPTGLEFGFFNLKQIIMNTEILNKYELQFFKKSNGRVDVKSSNHLNLAIYIYIYNYPENVILLLNDINLAINGQYDQIEDPDWGEEHAGEIYFGIINDDMTFSIYYENDSMNSIEYPLEDIKEIFESWLEFLGSN